MHIHHARSVRCQIVAFLITVVVAVTPLSIASAEGGGPSQPPRQPNQQLASDFQPTAAELHHLAAKDAEAKLHMQLRQEAATSNGGNVQPLSLGGHDLSVGTWLEPNNYAHRNYCGPGATQVTLDARLLASQVPGIETIATDEHLDPNFGVKIGDITTELNAKLSGNHYVSAAASGGDQLYSWVVTDIDSGWGMVTALKTAGMPGWGSVNAFHIVAIYGYNEPNLQTQYIHYTETAGSVAGYNGPYRQSANRNTFWTYVPLNNGQSW